MPAVFVVFAVLLLCVWGSFGATHDSDVVFYSLLLAYCKLIQDLDFSPHTKINLVTPAVPVGVVVVVCVLCMFPLLRTSPLVAVLTFASSCSLLGGEENFQLLLALAIICSMASETLLRLCYSTGAIYMMQTRDLNASLSLAVLFLLVHSLVVQCKVIKPMYVCALGVGLSLSCIVLVDLLTGAAVSNERLLIVTAFHINLFLRPQHGGGERITWHQVQQILGVAAGSLLAQHVVHHPFHRAGGDTTSSLEEKCKVSLVVTLLSLVFISKETPGLHDLDLQSLWYLRLFVAGSQSKPEVINEEPVQSPLLSTTITTTTPAIELSTATRSQPEIMELSQQYSGLLSLLARSEAETCTRTTREQCKRKVSEGTTLMRMLVLCEDMLQLMQSRILALQSEVKVFTSSSHVQMAKQSAVNLKLVETDYALVERMMLTKLKPKCARKHEEAMNCLNKWSSKEKQMSREEQQDYDTMVEVVRKRMKPKKQRTLAQAEDSVGGTSSPEQQQREVSVDATLMQQQEEEEPVAPPAKPSRFSSFRRSSASFSKRNDESMSSAGNASTTSTQKRKLRLLGMLPTFGKKKKHGGEEES